MNTKRCQSIVGDIKDRLYAIQTELYSDYQDGDYLLEKLNPIIHDCNVLKNEFEWLQKEQELRKKGE